MAILRNNERGEHRGAREQRRALRRQDRRRERARLWRRKGQTLIIFALTVTVLLGLAGLVIDAARAYDLYARMQRAADAGALAGVLYMPTYYNAARTPGDGLSAVCRAVAEVYKDGFGTNSACPVPAGNPCPTPVTSVEIAVCQISTAPSDLEVFITEHLDVTLLGELGVSSLTLTARSEAQYLPPVQIGSRENYFGDQVECSPDGTTSTTTSACSLFDGGQKHLQYFLATMNGPADLKESGDPYVYCEEGPAYLNNSTPPPPLSIDPNSAPATYNGKSTNHPQQTGVSNGLTGISQYCGKPNPGVTPGNPDYQPAGYDGPMTAGTAHDGGYNYAITVSSAISSASLWIFNPYYMPQDDGNAVDHFQDSGTGAPNYYQGPKGEGIGNNFDGTHRDAPLFFFDTTFTLYSVTNLYDRSTDNKVWSQTYQPFDDTSADLAQHSCPSGTVYDPYWNGKDTPNTYYKPNGIPVGSGCVSPPACEQPQFDSHINAMALNWSLWCEANYTLQPGLYRLVVEVTGLTAKTSAYNSGPQDGYGQHAYALKLCNGTPTSAVNCDNGAGGAGQYTNANLTIFGWNNEDITVQQTLGNALPNPNIPQNSCVTSTNYKYACVDLGCIPSVYAGRTVTAQLFDPGDGGGDLYLGIVQPASSGADVSIPPPSYAGVEVDSGATFDGDTVVHAHFGSTGVTPFNGLWLNFTIQLASTYSGSCPSTGLSGGTYPGWFQLVYMSNNGNPGDKLAIQFNLVGSPVHLVPPQLG